MIRKRLYEFFKEESAQGSIEYLLIVGAALVAAAMMASSYNKMTYQSIYSQSQSLEDTLTSLCQGVEKQLAFILEEGICE